MNRITDNPLSQIGIMVDVQMKKNIMAMAEERGMKLTEIGRRALKQYLTEQGYWKEPENKEEE